MFPTSPSRCCQNLKDTIWKQFTTCGKKCVVIKWCCQNLKDTIWKQFTTKDLIEEVPEPVLSEPQRYNLKAIHNQYPHSMRPPYGVVRTSKIQFESNSQHVANTSNLDYGCCQNLKDTIWKQFTTAKVSFLVLLQVLSEPQRYNLKAIHNGHCLTVPLMLGVVRTSKIQFESNSQRRVLWSLRSLRCCQNLKDTIWKQFTTKNYLQPPLLGCCQNLKDTIWKQFTTCSQRPRWWLRVLSEPQRYNLKAIHNKGWIREIMKEVLSEPQRYNLKAIHNTLWPEL